MKTPIVIALLAIVAFATSPASTAERACRPSLSNAYHCPDKTAPARRTSQTANRSGPACVPSLSNLWTCPGTAEPQSRSASNGRACRPSLSNGYSCPGASSQAGGSARAPERGCRPSLSNGYNCPGERQTGAANQYTTETLARLHCPSGTVVWANTRSNIYHFRSTSNYGNTKAGAYMCEQDALAGGIRAAKNERHP